MIAPVPEGAGAFLCAGGFGAARSRGTGGMPAKHLEPAGAFESHAGGRRIVRWTMAGKKYRCYTVDSHLNLTKKAEGALADFFMEVKGLNEASAREQVHFCDWFEKETAVKWFETIVRDGGRVVGYLRCLRNPEDPSQWFIGDVHVRADHRRQGIATKMYEKTVEAVMEYEAAECIVASVHPQNANSIRLHEKMGFRDTGRSCKFWDCYFDEKETEYQKWLYHHFPISDEERAKKLMLPLMQSYLKKEGLSSEDDEMTGKEKAGEKLLGLWLMKAARGEAVFESIWCGNRLVGFHYLEGEEEILYQE